VRVYLSPALVTFIQENPDALMDLEDPAVPGAMAVKEFYDADTVVGKAAIFYPQTDVVYYCYGPEGRCASGTALTTPETALWGDDGAAPVSTCNVCHSGLVYTGLP
jgi:hypothetical protein